MGVVGIIDKNLFQNEVEVEDVWGVEEEIYIEFNFRGAAYSYTRKEIKNTDELAWNEWLEMGYHRGRNTRKKYSEIELQNVGICPLTGRSYIPKPQYMTDGEMRLWLEDSNEADMLYSCIDGFLKQVDGELVVDDELVQILFDKALVLK